MTGGNDFREKKRDTDQPRILNILEQKSTSEHPIRILEHPISFKFCSTIRQIELTDDTDEQQLYIVRAWKRAQRE